jgi:hypothetical protein
MHLNKINPLKKMIGRRIFVIQDFKKFEGYVGVVSNVKNENHFVVNDEENNSNIVNIFNVRSLPYEW